MSIASSVLFWASVEDGNESKVEFLIAFGVNDASLSLSEEFDADAIDVFSTGIGEF